MATPARLLAATALVALAAALPAAASGATYKAPKSGAGYTGPSEHRGKVTLYVADRKTIQLAAIRFTCGHATGTTNLQDIRIKKTRRGYRFAIAAHGSVTFSDARDDENAAVSISGRFSRSARGVRGALRVRSPSCGSTGRLAWHARR
jgi:hypothetical protein